MLNVEIFHQVLVQDGASPARTAKLAQFLLSFLDLTDESAVYDAWDALEKAYRRNPSEVGPLLLASPSPVFKAFLLAEPSLTPAHKAAIMASLEEDDPSLDKTAPGKTTPGKTLANEVFVALLDSEGGDNARELFPVLGPRGRLALLDVFEVPFSTEVLEWARSAHDTLGLTRAELLERLEAGASEAVFIIRLEAACEDPRVAAKALKAARGAADVNDVLDAATDHAREALSAFASLHPVLALDLLGDVVFDHAPSWARELAEQVLNSTEESSSTPALKRRHARLTKAVGTLPSATKRRPQLFDTVNGTASLEEVLAGSDSRSAAELLALVLKHRLDLVVPLSRLVPQREVLTRLSQTGQLQAANDPQVCALLEGFGDTFRELAAEDSGFTNLYIRLASLVQDPNEVLLGCAATHVLSPRSSRLVEAFALVEAGLPAEEHWEAFEVLVSDFTGTLGELIEVARSH